MNTINLIIPFMDLKSDSLTGEKTFYFNHGLQKETLILKNGFDNSLLTFFFQGSLTLGFKNSLSFAYSICFNGCTFEDSEKAKNYPLPLIENINNFAQWQKLFLPATKEQKDNFAEQTLYTFGFNNPFKDFCFADGNERNTLQKMEDGLSLLPILSNEKDRLLFYAYNSTTYCHLEKNQFFGTTNKEFSLEPYQKMISENKEHLDFAKSKEKKESLKRLLSLIKNIKSELKPIKALGIDTSKFDDLDTLKEKAEDKLLSDKKKSYDDDFSELEISYNSFLLDIAEAKKTALEAKEKAATEKAEATSGKEKAATEKAAKILIIEKSIEIAPTIKDLDSIIALYKTNETTKFTLKDFQNFGKLVREKKATFATATTEPATTEAATTGAIKRKKKNTATTEAI